MYLGWFIRSINFLGYVWCIAALIITWTSDIALFLGKNFIFGVPVFDVKDSFLLGWLLFPGAVVIVGVSVLRKFSSIGMSKKSALRQYATKLGLLLADRYGKSRHYSRSQVSTTLAECRLNKEYAVYAYAIYLYPNDFEEVHAKYFSKHSPQNIRAEIALTCFSGEALFDGFSCFDGQDGSSPGGDGSGDSS